MAGKNDCSMAGKSWREHMAGNGWREHMAGNGWMRNGWRKRVGGKILRGKGCAKIRHSFEKNL